MLAACLAPCEASPGFMLVIGAAGGSADCERAGDQKAKTKAKARLGRMTTFAFVWCFNVPLPSF
jgi:hypothetical protein